MTLAAMLRQVDKLSVPPQGTRSAKPQGTFRSSSTMTIAPRDEEVVEEEPVINTRLDLTASLMREWSAEEKQDFCETVQETHSHVTTVHLSGLHLQSVLTAEQIEALVKSVGMIESVTELFCFQGESTVLTEDLLAASLPPNLQVLMLWQFRALPPSLAAAMRQHPTLTRVTLNLPCPRKKQLAWGCLDLYAMAFCSMERLHVLQIRCVPVGDTKFAQQAECVISPDAFALLLNSTSIQHLYLQNCGLIDDHMDIVYSELPRNQSLNTLDIKDNLFSDDCLYTTGRLLPIMPAQFRSLDVSGAAITDAAGRAVASGMVHNRSLQWLELEGTLQRFADEFDILDGHSLMPWMRDINHQLRINRAYAAAGTRRQLPSRDAVPIPAFSASEAMIQTDVPSFVTAVSSVSDNVSCIYHFLRSYPAHCNRLTVPMPHIELAE